jgi:hypothetical protein
VEKISFVRRAGKRLNAVRFELFGEAAVIF